MSAKLMRWIIRELILVITYGVSLRFDVLSTCGEILKRSIISTVRPISSSLNCYANRAFRKRSNLKTPALCSKAGGKHFENRAHVFENNNVTINMCFPFPSCSQI